MLFEGRFCIWVGPEEGSVVVSFRQSLEDKLAFFEGFHAVCL